MAEMKKRREQYINMSEAERITFKSEMLERFGGGGQVAEDEVVNNYKKGLK